MDLETYYRHVESTLVHLRDQGFALSVQDHDRLMAWHAAGLELEAVLRALWTEAESRQGQRGSRGLSLSRVERRLQGKGGRRKAVPRSPEPAQEPEDPSTAWVDEAVQRLRGRAGEGRPQDAGTLAALEALQAEAAAGLPPFQVRARLLAVARDHYDALVDGADAAWLAEAEAAVAAELGQALRRMSARGRRDTVREMLRRRMAERDPVLVLESP